MSFFLPIAILLLTQYRDGPLLTYIHNHKYFFLDLPKKNGQTLVITGGGRGIGYEAVHKFLKLGYYVILGTFSLNYLPKYRIVSPLNYNLGISSIVHQSGMAWHYLVNGLLSFLASFKACLREHSHMTSDVFWVF